MEAHHFDSTDVGLIESHVSALYSRLRIKATGVHTRARITRTAVSPALGFDDSLYGFELEFDGEPGDALIIGEMLSGGMSRVTEGVEDTFGVNDLLLLSRPGRPYRGVVSDARQRVTTLAPDVLARVATTPRDTPVTLLDTRPVSPAAARRLQGAIAHIRDSVLADPEVAGSPLVVSTATQYLAASVLHAFPNTASTDPTSQDRHDAQPTTVRRATAFIESSAETDIDLVDIANAAHVSPRALQYAFRRHVGMTPMAYLRRVRLDAAHRELKAADPDTGATVTSIAMRWGFAYPSRFAATYRKAYGQHPRTTLRS